jgi:ABC-2 type transport system permease protein
VSAAAASGRDELRVTQARVVRSEWTKLRSLRSSRWSVASALALTIALPCLFAAVIVATWDQMSPLDRANQNPLDIALSGMIVAQLPVAVLGVLAMTSEYATGMIRATLSAVPQRLQVLLAKAAVYSGVWVLVMLPGVLVAFLASQAILARHDGILQVSLFDAGVARALLGGVLYLGVVAAFGLGIGAIVRNTAASTATFGAVMFIVPPMLLALPRRFEEALSPYLPQDAGSAVYSLTLDPNQLAPWAGFAVFCAWTALTLAAAAALLVRRNT